MNLTSGAIVLKLAYSLWFNKLMVYSTLCLKAKRIWWRQAVNGITKLNNGIVGGSFTGRINKFYMKCQINVCVFYLNLHKYALVQCLTLLSKIFIVI